MQYHNMYSSIRIKEPSIQTRIFNMADANDFCNISRYIFDTNIETNKCNKYNILYLLSWSKKDIKNDIVKKVQRNPG
jgi:hypothetical protein